MAIDWNQYKTLKNTTSTPDINPDSGSPYFSNSAGIGADEYLRANNMARFQDPNAPLAPKVAAFYAKNGIPNATASTDAYFQHGPGKAVQGPDGDWFWQADGPIKNGFDYGIAAEENKADHIGPLVKMAPLVALGLGMGGVLPGTEALGAGVDVGGGVDMFGNTIGGGNFTGGTIAGSDGLGTGTSLAGDASWGVNPQLAVPDFAEENLLDPSKFKSADIAFDPGSSFPKPPTKMSWDDLFKNNPTTGNKTVDQLLSKAVTSSLGGANSASAGQGGDTTAADQQAAEEARKQQLIDQINAMYAPENFKDEEDNLSNSIRGQQGDALKLGYEKAARSTTFDAARRGNVGGSVMADNIAGLNRDNQLGATKIEDAVNSTLAGLRSARQSSQGNAINLVNAGSGPEGVNAAATGIRNAIDTATSAKLPDITQGLFQNVALSNQAINTGDYNTRLNGYAAARMNGGGSLFPLGSRAGGYNVPT